MITDSSYMNTVYMRLSIGGRVTSSEMVLIARDMHERLTALEEKLSEKSSTSKSKATSKREASELPEEQLSTP